jgi:aminoglycoside N3'-acetyltransferase
MNPKTILEAYSNLGVKSGDTLVVQSSFRGLSRLNCGPQEVVDSLLELVGESGNLIMPAYNFKSWTEGHYFDSKETPSTVGLIPETFRQTPGVRRTRHPIHSLSVRGPLAEELCELDDIDAFGEKSVFATLLRLNAVYSTLGLGQEMPFLPCHLAETKMKVPYRRQKLFSGIYVDSAGRPSLKTYGFHVRQLGTKQNPVEECHILLCDRKIVHEHSHNGIKVNAARAVDYHNGFVALISEKPHLFEK